MYLFIIIPVVVVWVAGVGQRVHWGEGMEGDDEGGFDQEVLVPPQIHLTQWDRVQRGGVREVVCQEV